MTGILPRLLLIDDLYGRRPPNRDREDLCARLGLVDVSPDLPAGLVPERIRKPIAEAVFCRGQVVRGGTVENDVPTVVEAVRSAWPAWPRWALALVDLHFKTGPLDTGGEPGGRPEDRDPGRYFGLTVLEHLRREFPLLPAVVFSAMERGEVSRDFTAHGAEGFLPRGASREQLVDILGEHGLLEDRPEPGSSESSGRIVGRSLSLLLALRQARKFAQRAGNVLVIGESGTGKELLARYLHGHSPMRRGPFEVLFTASLAESMFEAELFGYEKGVFTGQLGARAGTAERADGGTLFVDECGDIPQATQLKFNRLLDESTREVQRMGAGESQKLHLQIVLATNRDLRDLEAAGDVRSDFVHRIPARVDLPPLRERREDIPLLIETLLDRAVRDAGATPRDVTPAALDLLCNAQWPGNIRELRNAIERAVANHRTIEHLQPHHLAIESGPGKPDVPTPTSQSLRAPTAAPARVGRSGLDEVVEALEAFQAPDDYASLQGNLPVLRQAFARCLARYLKAALVATSKPSPQNPAGKINPTGAVKCMTGTAELPTGKAMDEIKRVLQVDPEVFEEVVSHDPVLAEAWRAAVTARKGPSKRSRKRFQVG